MYPCFVLGKGPVQPEGSLIVSQKCMGPILMPLIDRQMVVSHWFASCYSKQVEWNRLCYLKLYCIDLEFSSPQDQPVMWPMINLLAFSLLKLKRTLGMLDQVHAQASLKLLL